MSVLSIHSRVSRGYVGNSAAVPALQALGRDTAAVDTVVLSNHPGHKTVTGRRIPPDEVRAIAEAVLGLGAAPPFRAVLTGYLTGVETGRAALAAVAQVKAQRSDAIYVCDPILGDREEGIYVDEGLVPFFRREALPRADLALPNAFELELLTGDQVTDVGSAVAAAHALRARGTGAVVVTSVPDQASRGGAGDDGMLIGTLAVDDEGEWLIEVPRLNRRAKGAGDVLAGLLVGHLLAGLSLREAAAKATASVHGLLEAADEFDLDLPLIKYRHLLTQPERTLKPQAVR
ncbi:MAG TPA: pyridoxal kinase [Rhodospirillaceae bacterium]|nr:pyridoxal kinase [Rhodospirillaceae bacterium]